MGCIAGADWKGFNELHRMMRHRSVSMYGNKSQLYQGMDLLRSASQDAALPLFAIQARSCRLLCCILVHPIIALHETCHLHAVRPLQPSRFIHAVSLLQ